MSMLIGVSLTESAGKLGHAKPIVIVVPSDQVPNPHRNYLTDVTCTSILIPNRILLFASVFGCCWRVADISCMLFYTKGKKGEHGQRS